MDWWVPVAGVGENGELVFNGYGVSVGRWKVLETDEGDTYTTMYLINTKLYT